MDFIIYEDKTHVSLPSVTASTSAPKTLYHAATDLVHLNVGSGWSPLAQPGSSSVYSGFTGLDATTKANVLASVADVSSAPHTAHKAIAAKVANLTNAK